MDVNTTHKLNKKQLSTKKEIVWLKQTKILWESRKMILTVCSIGAIVGIIIGFSIPKEYTAKIFIAPENTRRSSSSKVSVLFDVTDIDLASSSATDRDAIYPSLYPAIINSTPFLIRLFDIKVREQKDTAVITLAQYIAERQKSPWWSIFTSVPSQLTGWAMSLFSQLGEKPEISRSKIKTKIDPFQLTREDVGIAGAISSKIKVGVDKEKRTITLFVTMQDPLVATAVADTVRSHLQEYITEYRTNKARRILEYNHKIQKEAQDDYYKAQEKYTRFADANRNLAMLTSRAELSRLRSEMELALTVYNQMEQQVRAAQAKVEKVTPVYAVIQPAIVPLSPSKPRKVLIITVCILFGGVGSIGWVLFTKDFLRRIRNLKNNETGLFDSRASYTGRR